MNKKDFNTYITALVAKVNELESSIKTQVSDLEWPQQEEKAERPNIYITKECKIPFTHFYFSLYRKEQPYEEKHTNYAMITSSTYERLRTIVNKVAEEWNRFLLSQRDAIKNEVNNSNLDVDKKNKIFDMIVNRSVIEFSMINVLSDLNKIESKRSVDAYKSYCADFASKYIDALKTAFKEQQQRYAAIEQVI